MCYVKRVLIVNTGKVFPVLSEALHREGICGGILKIRISQNTSF